MTVENAIIADDEILTEITKRSKAYWGDPEAQILIWADDLTVTKAYIETSHVFKLIEGGAAIGYYSYREMPECVKLDNLFILPEHIGKGLGSFLLRGFLERIKKTQFNTVVLDADPHAEGFYSKFGFIKTGHIQSAIPDRFTPIMELAF